MFGVSINRIHTYDEKHIFILYEFGLDAKTKDTHFNIDDDKIRM